MTHCYLDIYPWLFQQKLLTKTYTTIYYSLYVHLLFFRCNLLMALQHTKTNTWKTSCCNPFLPFVTWWWVLYINQFVAKSSTAALQVYWLPHVKPDGTLLGLTCWNHVFTGDWYFELWHCTSSLIKPRIFLQDDS